MTTYAPESPEDRPPYVKFSFGFKCGNEHQEHADYHLVHEEGISPDEVARWLNRALASSGLTTLQVMIKP